MAGAVIVIIVNVPLSMGFVVYPAAGRSTADTE
jgi:hypothetical protein